MAFSCVPATCEPTAPSPGHCMYCWMCVCLTICCCSPLSLLFQPQDMSQLEFLYLSNNHLSYIPTPLPESLRALHLQVGQKPWSNNRNRINWPGTSNTHNLTTVPWYIKERASLEHRNVIYGIMPLKPMHWSIMKQTSKTYQFIHMEYSHICIGCLHMSVLK